MRAFVMLLIIGSSVFSCHREDDKPCIDQSMIRSDVACPYILHEVCGCDGKTYYSPCNADKAGVTSWSEGPCQYTW